MAIWMVRAGSKGDQQSFALSQSLAVIGWGSLPDLSSFPSKDAMRDCYEALHADANKGRVSNHVGQCWAFANRIEIGDLVALPLKDQDAIAFGRVTGAYEYRPDNPPTAKHVRAVEWLVEDLPRSALDQDILYSLGAFLTVCRIRRNNAEARILAVLNGQSAPPIRGVMEEDVDEASDTDAPPNLDEYAATQIRAYISQYFAGHRFAELIDAILRAQGYKTHVSDPGPDGGVDILAGRGAFGFDAPRLCVQVKATAATQDIRVLRELKGIMKDYGAEQGLFVSWGGFKRSVVAEAKRHFFEIRLWDAQDVITAVQTCYESFSDSMRADLPLKRVWTLVQDEEGA